MIKQILIVWILLLNINFVQACDKEKKRIALVIGNSNYENTLATLTNPKNDVSGLAQALKTLDFYVFEEYDLTKAKMETVISDFGSCLQKTKDIGLFYYSGHGMQFHGENYLIPVDGSDALYSEEKDFLQHNIFSAEKMLKVMENAKNDANIIIIDACRNNTKGKPIPYDGVLHSNPPSGSIIAYAAASGKFALDRGDYAKHLIKEIIKPKVSITDVFLEVRKGVIRDTDYYQEPEHLSKLIRKIYLNEFTINKYHRSKRILPPREAIEILNISKKGNSINYWKYSWQKEWNLPSKDVYNDFINSVGSSLKSEELLDMAIKNVVSKS